jgi:hypothetical protein
MSGISPTAAFRTRIWPSKPTRYVPENLLAQFEALVACLNGTIFEGQQRLRHTGPSDPPESLGEEIRVSIGKFHRLIEMISSVINGATANRETIEPDEICASAQGQSWAQDEIDALF